MRPATPSIKIVACLSCFQVDYLRIDVFRPDAETDKTSWDPSQKWKSRKQPGRKRRFERCRLIQYSSNDPSLHRHLQPLGDTRG
jgi:hypothetical protein